jgi:segregation and condensation protein B
VTDRRNGDGGPAASDGERGAGDTGTDEIDAGEPELGAAELGAADRDAIARLESAADTRTRAAPAVPAELTETQLEALLFVAERPLSRREIAALAGVERATVDARLGDLEMSLAERGIRLVLDGERVELATAPEAGALVARYVGADAVRLSQASLETLAIVAYRQPVTKSAIERIRGVDSDYTIRTLVHRRLVIELGRSAGPGRPFLYGTGFEFLERFGIVSLEQLPALGIDVAARLAEEGGDDLVAPLPTDDDTAASAAAGAPAGATADDATA